MLEPSNSWDKEIPSLDSITNSELRDLALGDSLAKILGVDSVVTKIEIGTSVHAHGSSILVVVHIFLLSVGLGVGLASQGIRIRHHHCRTSHSYQVCPIYRLRAEEHGHTSAQGWS